jgi:hypothetical protein
MGELRLEPFSDAEITELAKKIGCDETKARETARRIEVAIIEVQRWRNMSPGQVKRELGSLRNLSIEFRRASRSVSRILQPDAASWPVERIAKQIGISGEFLTAMHEALEALSYAASHIADDAELYRMMSDLPVEGQIKNRQLPETRVLWPVLFEIWEQAHGRPRSATKRLVEFIDFVHTHAQLPAPVSENTVKSALKAWALRVRARSNAKRLNQLKDEYGPIGE